jgi:TPP-dependent pyruvate/acetoin dehydrogenase alpha subunit
LKYLKITDFGNVMTNQEYLNLFNEYIEKTKNISNELILNYSESELIGFMEVMLKIRSVENKLAFEKAAGTIKGPVHLSVGQEAIAAGVSGVLTHNDMVFGTHRSHGHFLGMGASPYSLFCEVLAKPAGASRGMGGSMHLWDGQRGFAGAVPIVAGTVSLALGAGLSFKLKKQSHVAIAYFGDGAIEEGVVHEALNFASIQKIPIIFVVENNLYASHMHISVRQPHPVVSRFAQANNIKFSIVNGNDVLAINTVTNEFINSAKKGSGPAFIEAFTYRWFGHVDGNEDIDVGLDRSRDEINKWKLFDPVLMLKEKMIERKFWSEFNQVNLHNKILESINLDWERALSSPNIDPSSLTNNVFFKA